MLDVQIRGAEQLRRVARALRRASDVELGRNLKQAIIEAGEPTRRDVADSARTLKTQGQRKPGARHPYTKVEPPKGTRAVIADAVTTQVAVDEENPRIRFSVPNRKLPPHLRGMPVKFDRSTPWRHPVKGNRNVWVSQTGSSWFWPPIRKRIDTFRAAFERAIEATKQMIERA